MNAERYALSANETFLEFEFYSEGPKGKIGKKIRFVQVSVNPNVYNLAFGDVDPVSGRVSDTTVTDNNDKDKILTTVAESVIIFSEHYPGSMVVAKGSTPSRTRLYQMRIAANLTTIQSDFRIYGLSDQKWELFTKNKPYEALLVERI
jgi:hypothetical protein